MMKGESNTMKPHYKPIATALAAALQLAAIAAVPVAWTNSPGMPPYPIKPVPHGSTVDLAVTLKGYTTPPIADGADVRLWYQTNGMGSAWWSAPATFDGSTITATFGPAQDCGADRVSLFFGAPSNVFASAVLRLTHAPGFTPTMQPPPAAFKESDPVFSDWLANVYTDRAPSYGTATHWTDATGCVWEVSEKWLIVPATFPGNAPAGFIHPIEAYAGKPIYLWEGYSPGGWWTPMCENLPLGLGSGDEDSTSLSWTECVNAYFSITATRGIVTNLVGRVALTSDIGSATNYIGQALATFAATGEVAYAESAGSTSYAAESGVAFQLSDPEMELNYTASDVATKGELGSVSDTANAAALDAASALRIVLGESVWFAVTNYMRTAEGVIPSLQLWEVRDSVTNLVYDSREEITNTVKALTRELHTELTNSIHAVSNAMPSKAWGNYQSDGTDNPEPGKVAIINPPTVILTGGGTFNKYLEVGDSSLWVLQSSGPVTFGGNTNGNYFAVLDDEGKPHLRVAKTDSYDLPAFISGILPRQSQNHILIYTATTNRHGNAVTEHPTISVCSDLKESVWHEEVDGEIDALGISVSWTRDDTIPAWVATVTPDNYPPNLYFRCKVVQEGGVAVINTAPTRFDGGVQFGNGTYRLVPYTTGGKTYLTLEH